MQNKILIYVLVFISLILIFLGINYTKISNLNDSNSRILKKKFDSLEDKYKLLERKLSDEIYFSLSGNQEALAYFNDIDIDSLVTHIRDELYEKNFNKKSDIFIPISNTKNKYLINKIKILNHKWIIADFSNGNRWGEMWIEYHFNENKVIFDIKDYFLY